MTTKALTFITYDAAHDWARKNARDYCHVHHYWKIAKVSDTDYAVAIHSKNTNALKEYAR